MMDDNEFDDVGYPDDYEAQYGAGSDDGWDMARADGCEPCGIGSDELEIVTSGFLGRDWQLICPYCGDVVDGGTSSTWRSAWDWVGSAVSRLVWRVRRATSGGMDDVPF